MRRSRARRGRGAEYPDNHVGYSATDTSSSFSYFYRYVRWKHERLDSPEFAFPDFSESVFLRSVHPPRKGKPLMSALCAPEDREGEVVVVVDDKNQGNDYRMFRVGSGIWYRYTMREDDERYASALEAEAEILEAYDRGRTEEARELLSDAYGNGLVKPVAEGP
jgi:hypothetical protein